MGDRGTEGDHAAALCAKLSEVVLPPYHGDRDRRVRMMKEAISKIDSRFDSRRMMRRYASAAYLR